MLKIVFVCLGNVYRSVYAEKRLKELVKKNNIDNVEISSAGVLHIEDGDQTQIDRVKNADLILTFEEEHNKILKKYSNNPIYTLREFVFNDNKDVEDPIHGGNPSYKDEIDKCMEPLLLKIKDLKKD